MRKLNNDDNSSKNKKTSSWYIKNNKIPWNIKYRIEIIIDYNSNDYSSKITLNFALQVKTDSPNESFKINFTQFYSLLTRQLDIIKTISKLRIN